MDSCAELGTLVVWASLHGILSFKKIQVYFYFLSVYFITEK